MDEQRRDDMPRRYEETTYPNNPPNSLLHKDARRAVVWSYFVPVVVLFVVVGAGLLYWSNRPSPAPDRERNDRAEIGTAGQTDGGFDPQSTHRPGNTRQEIERRGGDLAPVTDLKDLGDVDARTSAGRRVSLADVEVDSAQGNVMWLRDGDAKYQVVANDGAPTVKKGAKVDISGRVEPDSQGGVLIRADRIAQK